MSTRKRSKRPQEAPPGAREPKGPGKPPADGETPPRPASRLLPGPWPFPESIVRGKLVRNRWKA